jgi:hypothetical protein
MIKLSRLHPLDLLSLGCLACGGSGMAGEGPEPGTSTGSESTLAAVPTNTGTAEDGAISTSPATTSTSTGNPCDGADTYLRQSRVRLTISEEFCS